MTGADGAYRASTDLDRLLREDAEESQTLPDDLIMHIASQVAERDAELLRRLAE